MTTEFEAFLRELTALSTTHGFWINGCGECWVERASDREPVAAFLSPTDELDGYSASEYGNPYAETTVRTTRS